MPIPERMIIPNPTETRAPVYPSLQALLTDRTSSPLEQSVELNRHLPHYLQPTRTPDYHPFDPGQAVVNGCIALDSQNRSCVTLSDPDTAVSLTARETQLLGLLVPDLFQSVRMLAAQLSILGTVAEVSRVRRIPRYTRRLTASWQIEEIPDYPDPSESNLVPFNVNMIVFHLRRKLGDIIASERSQGFRLADIGETLSPDRQYAGHYRKLEWP